MSLQRLPESAIAEIYRQEKGTIFGLVQFCNFYNEGSLLYGMLTGKLLHLYKKPEILKNILGMQNQFSTRYIVKISSRFYFKVSKF